MAGTVTLPQSGADPVGAPDFTLPVSILAQVIESLKVDITAQSLPVLQMNIAGVATGVIINVAQTGQWTINIGNPLDASGNLKTSIQSSVTLNINITNCTTTLNVSITGTPTINIQTTGGTNIVLDKLTQSAFTERRSTLINDDCTIIGQTPPYYKTGEAYYGKFFPRGCRGMIEGDLIYAKGNGTDTITLAYTPQPGMAPIFTSTITPGTSWNWVGNAIDYFWNYDSCFVYIQSCGASVSFGYDLNGPLDGRGSINQGASWMRWDARPWIRVMLTMETVGDLPVCGTINTIEVPNTSSRLTSNAVSVPSGVETSLLTVAGSGKLIEARATFSVATTPSSSVYYNIIIYCDGVLAYQTSNIFITQSQTATSGRSGSGEFIQAGGLTYMNIRVPLEFKRLIELRVYQTSGSTANTTYGDLILSLKR